MLKALRLRLTLLYLAGSLGLVILLGAGTYGLLSLYFLRSTDLALQYKMATLFEARALTLPPELASALQTWGQVSNHPASNQTPITGSVGYSGEEDDDEHEVTQTGEGASFLTGEADEQYDGSLAPVFILPANGNTPVSGVPVVNDPAAISHALQTGSDLSTIRLEDSTRLRLLTYRIDSRNVLQVGRLLSDQDRLLAQYLGGISILGSISTLVLALASWILAGRSIQPTQRAWDQQQQFISNASHELRAPLTILRANADYALRNTSIVEREKSLQDIISECDYMNSMVEDLLLLSRINARHLVMVNEPIQLADLLSETIRPVEKLAALKGVTLSLADSLGKVHGDRARLRQVLLILLDNALRFTPRGGNITLEAQIRGTEAIIQVSDNGAGIPLEHQGHIFERFYQVPGQPVEGHGNGLGLAIALGIVRAHGGKINVKSEVGRGTTFWVILKNAGG
jgi:signal transduction histidine kinase